jgi:hypothetical protein
MRLSYNDSQEHDACCTALKGIKETTCAEYHAQKYFKSGGYKMRRYGCLSFLFDAFMVVITGGLWLIWIFVREMRRRR